MQVCFLPQLRTLQPGRKDGAGMAKGSPKREAAANTAANSLCREMAPEPEVPDKGVRSSFPFCIPNTSITPDTQWHSVSDATSIVMSIFTGATHRKNSFYSFVPRQKLQLIHPVLSVKPLLSRPGLFCMPSSNDSNSFAGWLQGCVR